VHVVSLALQHSVGKATALALQKSGFVQHFLSCLPDGIGGVILQAEKGSLSVAVFISLFEKWKWQTGSGFMSAIASLHALHST
jgi:hypothetical protein